MTRQAGAASGSPNAWNFRDRLWMLWFLLPIAVSVAVFSKALDTWFLMDDYAWLGLRQEVRGIGDLFGILFRPQAQGTVRVFSERVFFLTLSSLFGIDATPFRVVIFGTQFANLVLLGLVTRELTRSRVAAITASMLWAVHYALVVPISWVSCYNEVLWAFCLMAAFYCFLRHLATGDRRFLIAQWALYLFGFGVLELNVLYPAIVLLYTLCLARQHWRKAIPLFVPALLFAAAHFGFVPRRQGDLYRMYFDLELPVTLWSYIWGGFGPSGLGSLVDPQLRMAGYLVTSLSLTAAFGFVLFRIWRRDLLPVFLVGWFFIVLAPVLPLKNHRSDYYLAVPVIGLAILGGYAFAKAWKYQRWAGALVAVLLAANAAGMIAECQSALQWRMDGSQRLRTLLEGAAESKRRHPQADVLLLNGIDWDLYAAGFNDQPFRLYGLRRVFLTPSNMEQLEKSTDPLRGLADYRISPAEAIPSLESGSALVLQVEPRGVRNVTNLYKGIARAAFRPSLPRHLDAGLPSSAEYLGPTWYPIENGYRWMPDRATVRLAVPKQSDRLYLKGFVPKNAVPITITLKANGETIGSARFTRGEEELTMDAALPPGAQQRDSLELELSVDHTFQVGNDSRKLGLIFGAFELR